MPETTRFRRFAAVRPLRLPGGQKGELAAEWPALPPRRHVLRQLRALRRAITLLLFTLLAMPIQLLLLLLPGQGSVRFARFYWAGIAWIIGFRVRQIGRLASRKGGRPVLFASNHSSWLDVAVLGGRLDAAFIAKAEIGRWPFINLIARLGRTVFVSRTRSGTARERDAIAERFAEGGNIILFPEGTSSDGSRVMPFRSAFFAITEDPSRPLVQPVSIVYDRLAYLPAGRASRPLFAWYGDMNLAAHFWRLAQYRGLRASVLLHAPIDPTQYPDRKALAVAIHAIVADGAATLRQNRPVRAVAPQTAATGDGDQTALA